MSFTFYNNNDEKSKNNDYEEINGDKGLFNAIEANNVEKVREIIENDIKNNGKIEINHEYCFRMGGRDYYNNCLTNAVRKDSFEIVKILLSHPKIDPNFQPKGNTSTPLFFASYVGNVNVVSLLLQHQNIDPNKDDPLSCSINNESNNHNPGSNIEIIRLLLKHPNIDPNCECVWSPFENAFQKGLKNVLMELIVHPKIDIDKCIQIVTDEQKTNEKNKIIEEILKILLERKEEDDKLKPKVESNPLTEDDTNKNHEEKEVDNDNFTLSFGDSLQDFSNEGGQNNTSFFHPLINDDDQSGINFSFGDSLQDFSNKGGQNNTSFFQMPLINDDDQSGINFSSKPSLDDKHKRIEPSMNGSCDNTNKVKVENDELKNQIKELKEENSKKDEYINELLKKVEDEKLKNEKISEDMSKLNARLNEKLSEYKLKLNDQQKIIMENNNEKLKKKKEKHVSSLTLSVRDLERMTKVIQQDLEEKKIKKVITSTQSMMEIISMKICKNEELFDLFDKKLKQLWKFQNESTETIQGIKEVVMNPIHIQVQIFEKKGNVGTIEVNFQKIKKVEQSIHIQKLLQYSECLKKDIECFRKNCKKGELNNETTLSKNQLLNSIEEKYHQILDYQKNTKLEIETKFNEFEMKYTKLVDDLYVVCERMIHDEPEKKKIFLNKVKGLLITPHKRICKNLCKTRRHYCIIRHIDEIVETKIKVFYENFIESVNKTKLVEELMKKKLNNEKVIYDKNLKLMNNEHEYKTLSYTHGFVNEKQKSELKEMINVLKKEISRIRIKSNEIEQIIRNNYHNILDYLRIIIDEEYEKEKDPFIRDLKLRSIYVERNLTEDYTDKEVISSNFGLVLKAKYISKEDNTETADFLCQWKILKILDFDQTDKKESYTKTKNEILHLLRLKHPSIMKINHIFTYFSKEVEKRRIGIEMDFYKHDLLFWLKDLKQYVINTEEEYEKVLALPLKQDKTKISIVFKKILEGICYIHEQNVEHRDIKPQNIMINNEHDVRIIDFGISKTSCLPTATVLKYEVTKHYESPEKKHSKSSDMFAFGKMLFEALVKPEHVNLDFQTVFTQLNYLKSDEVDILKKLLEINPVKRITAKDALEHPFFIHTKSSNDKRLYITREDRIVSIIELTNKICETFKLDNNKSVYLHKNDVVQDFLNFVIAPARSIEELMVNLNITFIDESGIDVGGLTRELFTLFTQQIQDDEKKKYLTKIEDYYVLPSDEKDYQDFFKLIGKLICRCYLENRNLGISFGPLVYSFILNQEPKTLENWMSLCKFYDPMFLKSMERILMKSEFDDFVCTTFYDVFEGKERVLSSSTKEMYVLLKIKEKLLGTSYRLLNIKALKNGFYSYMPQNHKVILQNLLNPIELEHLIIGKREISKEILTNNITFSVFNDDHDYQRINEYLKQWINQSTGSQRLLFIYYVTGSNTIPYNGILSKKITIIVQAQRDKSFYSHSCSFQLDIGKNFQTFKEFKEKLDQTFTGLKFSVTDEIFI